ncbi:MAG TPA: hypothetical protein VHE60_13765 [Pyrinomonadaceae bacterium]|nr:hypothetical protein [Pyrinomonadaceae bacterium]
MATEQQVFSEHSVEFGKYDKTFWNWSGDNSLVPAGKTLVITTLTLNYFPALGGKVGRADVAGRIGGSGAVGTGNAVWRLQIIYVEPNKTVHLTFPGGLSLHAGGHVEIGFVTDGPGTIFVSANGKLISP